MTKNQQLMQGQSFSLKKAKEGFKNNWIVSVNKERFYLNQSEAEILHKATMSGVRGIVWFDNFAISIPHIQFIKREVEKISDLRESVIPSPKETTEGYKQFRKKIKELGL